MAAASRLLAAVTVPAFSTQKPASPATAAMEIRGVPYDVEGTVKALKKSGLPEAFATRLQSGVELALKNKELTCEC